MSRRKALRIRLEGFIASERGQRFFNFAYSIGAAIVILGALFKILHMPGGDTLLTIGMGTEVIMFILNAFDRPSESYDIMPEKIEADTDINSASRTLSIAREAEGVMAEITKLQETTSALNALYELQLKKLTSQINTIESSNHDAAMMRDILERSAAENRRYCAETMKMAENMAQLNAIYERMITAMSSGNAMVGNKF